MTNSINGKPLWQESKNTAQNDRYVNLLVDALTQKLSETRTGIHVSSVVLCPRQQVFKQLHQLPMTKNQLNFFSSGKAIHYAIQSLMTRFPGRFEREMYLEYEGIEGHVDLYDKRLQKPIELKTSRSSKMDSPKSFHLEQLKYYTAMLNKPNGTLLYQLLMNFDGDPFKEFNISMSEQDRKRQLDKLVFEITSLQNAKLAADPSMARHVAYDSDLNWLCKECPYSKECEEIRLTEGS